MNPPEQTENDPLDALLREQNPYIDDNGFTTRVITNLPRRRNLGWVRPLVLLGATFIGCVLMFFWLPSGNLPALNAASLLAPDSQVILPWLGVAAVWGALVYGALSAVRWED